MDHDYIREHSLIERYHQRSLPPDEEARFEEHFLTCAHCREELRVAREFRLGMREAAVQDARSVALSVGFAGWLLRRSAVARWGLLAAMLLLMLAPGAWLLLRTSVTAPPTVNAPLVLMSTLRSPSQELPVLDLSGIGDRFWMALDTDPDLVFESYRATLRDSGGNALWQASGLSPNALEVVLIDFPVNLFPAGVCSIILEGEAPSGDPEEVSRHTFRVSK